MKSSAKKHPTSRQPARTLPRERRSTPSAPGCPIVGIGASAGGLEAFTNLLKQLPVDTGMGFVLVQHLDPQHDSALAQLLARVTTMPVSEVSNNLRVEANRVYIIPPNTTLGVVGGVLKLQPRPKSRVAPRSIDFFFEALAKDQRERAIGVILSGSATDGTLGLEAIKAEGGLTFAQDSSARYDSMPRSAAAAGCVDFVLSPGNIAKELARIARHPYVAAGPRAKTKGRSQAARRRETGAMGGPESAGYQKILVLLRNHYGVDFSLYKSSTIQRRITRRAVLSRCNTLEDYANFLRGNAKEIEALYSDALINVTSFFRNADAFQVLQRRVFPKLLQQRGHEPLRVWVLGCSTGQEAYSLAMAFAESTAKLTRGRKFQIFATDLNEANLEKARHGFYSKSLVHDVSPGRLRRFFVEEEGGYRVIKTLRESVVFARQNVISDPPFSRMDLISCRNLMIYLESSLQKKVIPTFHYALNPGGFLFLGASESVGSFAELFATADKKQKIYVRKAAPTLAFQLPMHQDGGKRPASGKAPRVTVAPRRPGARREAIRIELSAEHEADRVTVNQLAPPSVLVNGDLQILQFRGSTNAYLEPAVGKASFDLLKMAREGLMLPLRAAIQRAQKENRTAREENVRVVQEGRTRLVNVEVVPLKNLPERCFLVLFEDSAKQRGPVPDLPVHESPTGVAKARLRASKKEDSSRMAGLERDLSETRDYLQSVQEHQESANEELQASNEEGQSANEELQSLNEELETSKEELESTNEELTTVNEEMANRNAELHRLNEALREAQALLSQHAGRQEQLVAERTGELTAANRELETSLASTLKGKEEYRELLERSQVMQKRLRHLTHKIITAQEEERREISRELHDEVVQTLIGINVELSALTKRGLAGTDGLREKISQVQRLVETSVTAVHRFARGLRPAVLDDLGLIPALHAHCKSLAMKHQIKIHFTAFGGVEALGGAERTVLFRVAQEALTNVVRHAKATEVKLSIIAISDAIRLEISDNGKSFQVGNTLTGKANQRLGLVGMNERVEMVGGTLAIESVPGRGTLVRAEIPFYPERTKK
jgi:two-component system, chemotaxis family, CheB/CheR fusion protein